MNRGEWVWFPSVEWQAGGSKWSFRNVFVYSVEGILAFSTAPLQIASLLGITSCLLAFGMLIFVFLRALFFGDPVSGWPSLICVIVFFGGLQLFVVGILGTYLAKTYTETKSRPLYIIQEEK